MSLEARDAGHGSAVWEGGQVVTHTDTVSGAAGYGQSAVTQLRFSGEPTQLQQVISTRKVNYEDKNTHLEIKPSVEKHERILK
jgi:hypothetical protein